MMQATSIDARKGTIMPRSEALKKAQKKYFEDRVELRCRVRKEEADRYRAGAKKAGMSFSKWLISLMEKELERQKTEAKPQKPPEAKKGKGGKGFIVL